MMDKETYGFNTYAGLRIAELQERLILGIRIGMRIIFLLVKTAEPS